MYRLLVALLLTATAAAEPKSPTSADDPALPDGAVARLGSARSRVGATYFSGSVAFSPDGKLMALPDRQAVAILDAATGQLVRLLPVPDAHTPSLIRFLADGKRLAVGTTDYRVSGRLIIFDLADGKSLVTSTLPAEKQLLLADVTADGVRVLAVDWFAKVYLWDVKAGREVWSFAHEEAMYVLPMTVDGKHFVMSGGSRQAEFHDAATGKLVSKFPDPGPQFRDRYHPGMSGDGRIALGADTGDAIVILAAQGKDRVRTLASNLFAERFFFSPDGRYLVAPMPARTRIWDLNAVDDRGPIALPGAGGGAFAPDGTTLVLGDEGALTFWSVGTWKRLPQSADPPSPVSRVWFARDGQRVVGYTRQGFVTWLASGGPMTRVSDDSAVSTEPSVDLSADGRVAIDLLHELGRADSRKTDEGKFAVRVTDLTTGKDHRIGFDARPWSLLQVSPDGRHVSALDRKLDFCTWDAATGAEIGRTKRLNNRAIVFGAVPTADGKGMARSVIGQFGENAGGGFNEGPMYSSVTLADHQSGSKRELDPMPWSVYSNGARFSRDLSRAIVIGRFDRDWEKEGVSVWDVSTGRRLMNWTQESGPLASVVLAADNRSLLSGTRKGKLSLVEVAIGGERASFQHRGQVTSAAFHPDGTKVASSSPDAPVYVWDLLGEPGRWDPARADTVWADLLSPDAKVAFGAIRNLRANPTEAIAFLKDRVRLPAAPADEAVAKLLKGLDAAAFAERERSQRELTAIADLIRPKLDAARKTASEEAGRRLDQVLKSTEGLSPEKLRQIRACEVLEGIGTSESVQALKAWAAGLEGARLTTEAKESVARRLP